MINDVLEFAEMIETDFATPNIVKERIKKIKNILNQKNIDLAIKADKCLNILESLDDDPNIEAFTRTNIWNLVSMLEKLKE